MMPFLVLFLSIALLVVLIVKKMNPMLALLTVSLLAGLFLGMAPTAVLQSITRGIGDTLGSTIMVIALGAMIGKLAEESGAAQRIVQLLTSLFGQKHIRWAVLCTGILAGIPLFYNAGFVVLIPIVFAVAAATRLPALYVGMPMAAALSVTHGFLPPHPGPVSLAALFHANLGLTLLYGLIISIPIAIFAGIVLPGLLRNKLNRWTPPSTAAASPPRQLPSGAKSLLIVLMPIAFIAIGTIGNLLYKGPVFTFLQDPTPALLLSLLVTLLLLRQPMNVSMQACADGVRSVAMILLIIAAGGAFKEILVESQVSALLKAKADALHFSPLLLGWMIAALFRIALGSATVAALTAAGMMAPFIVTGVSPELMVLAVGAGSLTCSHVNDTGFWMFKEYFGLTLRQTFLTWTLMETTISVAGLAGVLLLDRLIH